MEAELKKLRKPVAPADKEPPKRKPLPDHLPRTDIRHEPDNTACQCGCQMKRIGEDITEKLDYDPGTFSVERHIRGKWVCTDGKTLVPAPGPAEVIDKGIPTSGLLAHVLVAKPPRTQSHSAVPARAQLSDQGRVRARPAEPGVVTSLKRKYR